MFSKGEKAERSKLCVLSSLGGACAKHDTCLIDECGLGRFACLTAQETVLNRLARDSRATAV